MHKKIQPDKERVMPFIKQFPHCDQRVLHAPGECIYCDKHGLWQALRIAWGIAFTGYVPDDKELPCPADYARGDKHKLWGGNVARTAHNAEANTSDPGGILLQHPSAYRGEG